jgi:hypothetical protein
MKDNSSMLNNVRISLLVYLEIRLAK